MLTLAPADSPTHHLRPAPIPPFACNREAIRRLTDELPVTREDLAVLARTDGKTVGYRNTYLSCDTERVRSWRARVVKNVNLPGVYPSDLEAAKAVVRWLRNWYGPDWKRAFKNMRANRGYARWSSTAKGKFRAVVYVRGESKVVYRDAIGGDANVWEMDSPKEARRAIRAWLARHHRQYGPYARLLLWRA